MTTKITHGPIFIPGDFYFGNVNANKMSGALQLPKITGVDNTPLRKSVSTRGGQAPGLGTLQLERRYWVAKSGPVGANSSTALTDGAAPQAIVVDTTPAKPVTTGRPRVKTFIKSLFTAKNINKAIKVAGVAMSVAAVFSAVAVLVGVAAGPLLIVTAVGFGIGALVCLLANRVSRYFAKAAVYLAENKSPTTKAYVGSLISTSAACGNNASQRGVQIAGDIGYCLGLWGAKSGYYQPFMTIASACGKAIGEIDTMMWGTANLAKQWGAGIGAAAAGWLGWCLGVAERDLDKIAHAAAVGTNTGASMGRFIDDFIFTPLGLGMMRRMENRYLNSSKNLFSLPWTSEESVAGPIEWLAAISGGTLAGGAKVVDIHTEGEISRIGEAVDTARQTLSFSKLLRAAGNDLDMRPGATLNAMHTAWHTVSFGKLVSAVYNCFELRIPHPA